MKLNLHDIAQHLGVPADPSWAAMSVSAVHSDSRSVKPGGLFVALRGARADGHDFLPQVRAAGAVAALVDHKMDDVLPQLVVPDVLAALGQIANLRRQSLRIPVLALTGSNGKTTVKNLAAAILAEVGQTYATRGNRNNELGLPLSLLEVSDLDAFAVLEMGAGAPGDIAYLSQTAQPTVALVNNIGPAHLERLGSLDGVAAEKASIYRGLGADGVAIVPADDAYADSLTVAAAPNRSRRFGLSDTADVRATQISAEGLVSRFTLHVDDDAVDVALALPGLHNVRNALAAAALAHAAGATLDDIALGLSSYQPSSGRFVVHEHEGYWLIDDCYNANPASMQAGINAAVALGASETWLALGDMAELGDQGPELHTTVGRYARAQGVTRLFAVGPLGAHTVAAMGSGALHYADQTALISALTQLVKPGVALLVKGSRSAAMERVIEALRARKVA